MASVDASLGFPSTAPQVPLPPAEQNGLIARAGLGRRFLDLIAINSYRFVGK
jgi:hypothetical protein